jgi:hypothetical protein
MGFLRGIFRTEKLALVYLRMPSLMEAVALEISCGESECSSKCAVFAVSYMHERQIVFDCPHCGSSKVAFTSAGYKGIPGQPELWIVLMQCGCCSEGIVVKLRGSVPGWLNSGQRAVQVISVHPRAQPPTAPEYVPTNVGGFYEQGLDCVLRKNFDAAGAMFRKALDTAVKIIIQRGRAF